VCCGSAFTATAADHPYVLWTAEEAAAIRRRIEREDWAKAEYERMKALEGFAPQFVRMFDVCIVQDAEAREAEKEYLLSFVGARIGESRRHTMYLHGLRYDILYDELTGDERRRLEDTFRKHIRYQLDNPRRETRISWLPNMQWPRMLSAHILAAAMRDKELMRRLWESPNGIKWYFDDYLADGGLYFEEFGKIKSCVGTLLLWCRACDRLGVPEMGFEHVGKGGATMRSYVESLVWIGYPRIEFPSGLHHYPRVTMGDARGAHIVGEHPRFLFQHAVVPGSITGDVPYDERDEYYGANMNGRDHRNTKLAKLAEKHWYEILHAKYPEGPFGYFLAQMRHRGDRKYVPTLYWGLEPIDPRSVTPPPAPSRVFPERGFAMLRADESPRYWESGSPAVALQFATLYVHYLADCFSLLGYHQFGRPIYYNRSISSGYNGGPWEFHVRGHCGVVVDGLQAQPIGPVPSRHQFAPPVKFVSATTIGAEPIYKGEGEVRSSDQPKDPAKKVYPDTDLTRALFLTNEYLLDVYRVTGDRPRTIHWIVHAPGEAQPADPARWKRTTSLGDTLLDIPEVHVPSQHVLVAGDKAWALKTLQTCAIDPAKSIMGKAWYDRKVGVRIHMLGAEDTSVYFFDSPTVYTKGSPRTPREDEWEWYSKKSEVGGVSVAVQRRAEDTTFVALHEPFQHDEPIIDSFDRIAESEDAVAVRIVGKGVNDRVLYAFAPAKDEVAQLGDDGESFTFKSHGFVRVGRDTVEVVGDVRAMSVKVSGSPKLLVNGQPQEAKTESGALSYGL
jgi:hypothetical protein